MKIFVAAAIAAVLVSAPAFAAPVPLIGSTYEAGGANFQNGVYGGALTLGGDMNPNGFQTDGSFTPTVDGIAELSPGAGGMLWNEASYFSPAGSGAIATNVGTITAFDKEGTLVEIEWNTANGGPYSGNIFGGWAVGITNLQLDSAFRLWNRTTYLYFTSNGVVPVPSQAAIDFATAQGLAIGPDPKGTGDQVVFLSAGNAGNQDAFTDSPGVFTTDFFEGTAAAFLVQSLLDTAPLNGVRLGVMVSDIPRVIPEPTSGLFLAGLATVGAVVRRRRHK